MVFLKILLITAVFMALAFAGFAIKMFIKKDGEFKKQCSSVHPKTGQKLGCVCDGQGDGTCKKEDKGVNHVQIQPLEVK